MFYIYQCLCQLCFPDKSYLPVYLLFPFVDQDVVVLPIKVKQIFTRKTTNRKYSSQLKYNNNRVFYCQIIFKLSIVIVITLSYLRVRNLLQVFVVYYNLLLPQAYDLFHNLVESSLKDFLILEEILQ